MKMNCLFGGALLGAGLCAGSGSTAFGGDFVWGYQTSTNIAGGGFTVNYSGDGDFSSAYSYSSSVFASMSADASGFLVTGAGTGGSAYGYIFGRSIFSVSEDLSALFEWDTTNSGLDFSFAYIFNTSDSSYEVFFLQESVEGSATLNLAAGDTYYIQYRIVGGYGMHQALQPSA